MVDEAVASGTDTSLLGHSTDVYTAVTSGSPPPPPQPLGAAASILQPILGPRGIGALGLTLSNPRPDATDTVEVRFDPGKNGRIVGVSGDGDEACRLATPFAYCEVGPLDHGGTVHEQVKVQSLTGGPVTVAYSACEEHDPGFCTSGTETFPAHR
jgi:hypothetical protein